MMSLKSPAEKCDGTNQSSTNRMRGEQLDDMRFKKMHQLDDGSAAPFRVNGDINSRNPPAANQPKPRISLCSMKDSEMIVLKFLSKLAAVRARYIEHQAIRESQKRANELLYLKTSAVKLARSRFVVPSEKRRYSQFSAARHDRPIDRQLVEPRSEQPGGINASEISYSNQLEKGISKIHRLTNPSDINTILHHVPERRRSLHDLLN